MVCNILVAKSLQTALVCVAGADRKGRLHVSVVNSRGLSDCAIFTIDDARGYVLSARANSLPERRACDGNISAPEVPGQAVEKMTGRIMYAAANPPGRDTRTGPTRAPDAGYSGQRPATVGRTNTLYTP